MWLQFRANFAGRYIEMCMRLVHLSMRTEDITAFSKRIRHYSVDGENDTKTLSVDANCWFSHDVTKFQTSELLILLRFYFHDVLEQLKTNIQTNFHSEWVLGLVIAYA